MSEEISPAYDAALIRVGIELREIADRLYPEVAAYKAAHKIEWPGMRVPDDDYASDPEKKITEIAPNLWKMHAGRPETDRFYMLLSLRHNKPHDAIVSYIRALGGLTGEEKDAYLELMLDEADRASKEKWFGYTGIVTALDDAGRTDLLPAGKFKDAVNRSFWEFAKYYAGSDFMTDQVLSRFRQVMKYSKMIDLADENLKNEKPLNSGPWVGRDYIDAFERALPAVGDETAAWLAHPIIDSILKYLSSFDSPLYSDIERDEVELARKEIGGYSKYMGSGVIQRLMEKRTSEVIGRLSDDDGYLDIRCARAFSSYLGMDGQKLRTFISSCLDLGDESEVETIVKLDFPKEWLTKEAMRSIRRTAVRLLREPEGSGRKPVIPNIELINEMVETGFVGKRMAGNILEKGMKAYLKRKQAPSGKELEHFIGNLDPELVDPDLYSKVRSRVEKDLGIRHRDKLAGRLRAAARM
jgi:hypothetical protein